MDHVVRAAALRPRACPANALQHAELDLELAGVQRLCREEHALADEVGDEAVGRAVVQVVRRVPLLDATLVQDADLVGDGERPCWSCVTSTAVAPLALMMSRSSCDRRSRKSVSRCENGSSRSRSSGRGASASRARRAAAARPRSRAGTCRASRIIRPARRARAARRALGARQFVQAERNVRRRRKVREERIVLEHHADAPPLGRNRFAGRRHHASRKADFARLNRFEPGMQRRTVVFPPPLGPSRQPIAPRSREKLSPAITS